MRKHFLKLFVLFVFFLSPLVVKADFGDLRYEVTNLTINGSEITFQGWAFIHKTNNFVNVEKKDGSLISENGGQKILIRAYNGNNVLKTVVVDGSEDVNYNFYCELFFNGARECTEDNYSDITYNTCVDDAENSSQCYYEDIYFNITFDTSEWVVSEENPITFKIAVANNFFAKKKGDSCPYEYDNSCFTSLEDVSIANAIISNNNGSDYIKISKDSITSKVRFIASHGLLINLDDFERFSKLGKTCAYGRWSKISSSTEYDLVTIDNFPNGRSSWAGDAGNTGSRCPGLDDEDGEWLGTGCKGTYFYAIKVAKSTTIGGYGCDIADPTSGDDYYVAVARGSHVRPTGSFKITVKNDKKCTVTNPLPSELSCNDSGTLSSVCDELTVHTDKGSAIVRIEQTGTVSNVLTPNRTYAGGGFKFGIMYYNNIKWSYVGGYPGDELHNAINTVMNDKLKDYDAYIAGITITDLKLGDKSISSGMVRQCSSSSTSKDYYGNSGLSVSCIFTFPSSTISYDGTVKYNSVSNALSFGINNKYYTLLDKNGKFSVTATINGMNRITDDAAKSDSAEEGKAWTGSWVDSIDDCEIELYPLLYNSDGKYKFIYRPIDIYNPFPNRNAGINWYDWYNNTINKERLENTYSVLQYTATINNSTMNEIKEYNKDHNYLDWDSIDSNGNSSFVDDYVKREGGS